MRVRIWPPPGKSKAAPVRRTSVTYCSQSLRCGRKERKGIEEREARWYGKNAPDARDADGKPTWKGSARSVMERVKGYCRARGLRHDSFES
jgi:hypothetical protein